MTNPRLPVSEGPSVVAADDLLEKHMLTPDPVARALAQVEREAREAATEPASKSLYVIATAAERDVWKAAAERALRALRRLIDAPHGRLDGESLAECYAAHCDAAACFPPEREEPNYER